MNRVIYINNINFKRRLLHVYLSKDRYREIQVE